MGGGGWGGWDGEGESVGVGVGWWVGELGVERGRILPYS